MVLLLVGLAVAGTNHAFAAAPPTSLGGTLAVSYDNGLYTLAVRTGARPRFMTAAYQPAWSPDGRWLAYTVKFAQLWRRRSAAGSAAHPVARPPEGATDTYPSWSPDGTRLAFTRFVQGATVQQDKVLTCVVRIGSSHVGVLAPGRDPDWSPDGTTIVFARDDGLWLIGPDGHQLRKLAGVGPGAEGARWSRDSRRIAYIAANFTVHVLDLMSGTDLAVESALPVASTDLAWSPDGTSLAFATYRKVQEGPYLVNRYDLVIDNLRTGERETLLRGRSEFDGLSWRL